MSAQDILRAGLATIQGLAPNAVATVIYKGTTATALKSTIDDDASLGSEIEEGVKRGRVRINSSLISRPGRGDTIIVDGNTAFVSNINEDPVDAMWNIEYQDQRPVEGV